MTQIAPSLDNIHNLAEAAWQAMPEAFRALAGDVLIRVQDFADEDVLAELGIENPFELSGLYQGVDLTQRSIMDPAPSGSIAFLYRRAILDEWIERSDVTLAELVSHVLVHEIGHHFGLSDDAMDKILEEAG
jgi:predicted Zn-dependent protease with MMP-like domain